MIKAAPISFVPYLKRVIWGGDKICRYKKIESLHSDVGESWEISAVPGSISVVADGPYKGMTLEELTERFGAALLGERVYECYGGKFPLLVKLIDASDNLSVQVHPCDELAMRLHGCRGKSEMWYVIDAEKDARIFVGFNRKLTPEEYRQRVADHTFFETLASHQSCAGDVFYLPAGRVHAIGAGNLLVEIQESSDITYRIYDYDRLGADGKPRELHTQRASMALDYAYGKNFKSPPVESGRKDAEIVRCEHFTTRRLVVKGSQNVDLDAGSFTVVMCIDGELTIRYPEGETTLAAGHTVLLPAILSHVDFSGNATALLSQSL